MAADDTGVESQRMNEPIRVEVASVAPIAVEQVSAVAAPKSTLPDQRVQQQGIDPSVPAKTTFQEDLVTAGQRRVNLVWEYTQAAIAISVSFTTLGVCALLVSRGQGFDGAFLLLSNVFFLVVGTYFQRTNHTKTGGVGPHETGR